MQPNKPEPKSRLDQEHGGKMVEAVKPEDLVSFNDADCKHENKIPDPSETEFDAYLCANTKCNEVFIYAKS